MSAQSRTAKRVCPEIDQMVADGNGGPHVCPAGSCASVSSALAAGSSSMSEPSVVVVRGATVLGVVVAGGGLSAVFFESLHATVASATTALTATGASRRFIMQGLTPARGDRFPEAHDRCNVS